MNPILNLFWLCKKKEYDEVKEKLDLLDSQTEGLLNQIDNLQKFEEIAKKYVNFEYELKGGTYFLGIPMKPPKKVVKVLVTNDQVLDQLKREQLYNSVLKETIKDDELVRKADVLYLKLLEVKCHEDKSDP